MATAAEVALTGANAIPGRHTFKKTFALQYPNGDAVDLTPYSANGLEAEFRLDANNASKVFDLAGAGAQAGSDGIDISGDATLGLIEITISDATTEIAQAALVEAGVYDVVGLTSGSTPTVKDRLMQGSFEIDNGVSDVT
jgi:hypothetical protein